MQYACKIHIGKTNLHLVIITSQQSVSGNKDQAP